MSILKTRQEFNRTIKRGKRIVGGLANAVIAQNNNKPSKIGIIVPKTKIKSAVKRNRVKRIFKEAFRLIKKGKDIRGTDMVIYPKAISAEKGSGDAKEFIKEQLGI